MHPPFDTHGHLPRPLAIRCEVRTILGVIKEYLETRCRNLPYEYTFIAPLPGGIGVLPAPGEGYRSHHEESWESRPVSVLEFVRTEPDCEPYQFAVELWICWDLEHYSVVAKFRHGVFQKFVVGGCLGSPANENAVVPMASLLNSIYYRLQRPEEFLL